ncbi:hypothetical protein Ct9H90mP12_1140 [bacterium]|nr:MAG: hypothetical protein Ct9H90mP12_1140 [bacterium]
MAPFGGTFWMFDLEDYPAGPFAMVGNWHNWDGSGEGVTDGPRGAAWDAEEIYTLLIFIAMVFTIMLLISHLFQMMILRVS